MQTDDLIVKLKSGDNSAFAFLVDEYRKNITTLCYGFVRNQEDAEDITQEVFIEVYRSINNFRSESSLSTWIYRIAVSRSLNHIKKNKFKNLITTLESVFSSAKNYNTPEADIPDIKIENKEKAKEFQKIIDSLPENQRIAFVLNKYDDLSYNQTAEVMGVSISAVESLIHRAKNNIKKQLVKKQ